MSNHKQEFDTFVQTELNSEQQKAIAQKDGSYLVIAGAGSGKTRVITARITNLILEHNVEPSSIIALTFTNKAAQEMRDRIEKFLPAMPTKPIIATFHSYCLRLLKTHRHLLNKETFSVIDAQDQYKLVQTIIKEHGVANLFNAKQLLAGFSEYKMNHILDTGGEPTVPDHLLQQFMELYNAYEQQKRSSNYLDFDDLLYTTFELFSKNQEFRKRHQQMYRHLLVDEYQDTNLIQHELLKMMSLDKSLVQVDSLCAVGDEDQSIYSWRGATVKNILEFHKEFPGTKVIKLEQNYRSSQRILDIANNIIANNTQRNHKKLWSANTKHHVPLQLECLSDLQEAFNIINIIKTICKTSKLSSIALLYRTHYQSRIIEEALLKESIPYRMIGGIQFYERKEIKDLIAYLKLIANPRDKMSFLRVINCPLRGLGKKFEELFMESWNQNPFSTFIEIAQKLIEDNKVSGKQKGSLQSFVNVFNHLSEQTPPLQALETVVKAINYPTYLTDHFDKQEAQVKKENVAEFLRAAQYVQNKHNATLSNFLDDIALMQEHIKQDQLSADCVQLMTLHSAKGLEFETVILSGLEDGVIPSNQSIENGNIEEERRLFYVGVTRAKKRLILTHSKHRNTFGQMTLQQPSRFLDEIPPHLITAQQANHWSRSQFVTFLSQWTNGTQTTSTIKLSQPKPQAAKTTYSNKGNKTFKRLQTVKHPKFGIGIAQQVEAKGNKTFITVHFSNYGKKKIEASFLDII